MTLAGLDDTHTMDGMGMDGRDLVQLSGQRNGQMISVFVFFSTMDDTSITVRYTIYTWTKNICKIIKSVSSQVSLFIFNDSN